MIAAGDRHIQSIIVQSTTSEVTGIRQLNKRSL
jgi:hypothetical protein